MSLASWKKERRFSRGEHQCPTPIPARRYLNLTYGITRGDFQKLRDSQNGQCAICGRENGAMFVDHDHETGHVRGLLCDACNSALGIFGDCFEGLEAAMRYVTNPPGEKVLGYYPTPMAPEDEPSEFVI